MRAKNIKVITRTTGKKRVLYIPLVKLYCLSQAANRVFFRNKENHLNKELNKKIEKLHTEYRTKLNLINKI